MKHNDTFSSDAAGSEAATSRTGQSGNPEILQNPGIPFVEFVTFIAMIMALNAMAIDVMLPALPAIGDALNIVEDNDRQMILLSYLIGFGGAQLFFGPVTDAYGRRIVLLGGLALYSVGCAGAIFSMDVDQLLATRILQGIGCAAARVTVLSIIRDCYTGRRMGKVMSLVMMVFMAVPVIAPSIGQALLLAANWHWIFVMLFISGAVMLVWCATRMPETLSQERRRPMVLSKITGAYRIALTTRISFWYTIASAFIFGGLFAFLAMSQQIFVGIFGLGVYFPIVFAAIAISIAAASFMNAQLVEAIGMRRLSHAATLVYTAFGFAIYAASALGMENLWFFLGCETLIMMSFGFMGANYNSMAMEPLGEIAGTASSVIGSITTLGGAILGYFIGQMFDGTTQPLGLAYGLFGILAIGCVLYAERGQMFHAQER